MNTKTNEEVTQLPDKIILIINAADQHWYMLQGKYLYHLRITVPVNTDIHSGNSVNALNSLVRSLVNSKMSVNDVNNRTWFQSYFLGGCYNIFVNQRVPNSVINVHYDIFCIGTKENLHEKIHNEINQRIRKIFPEAITKLNLPVHLDTLKRFQTNIINIHATPSLIYLDSEPVVSLDHYLRRWILEAITNEVINFGILYKMVHQPYNLLWPS